MLISETQRQLLQKIKEKSQRGDVKKIAKKLKFSQKHVSQVLNPDVLNEFNEKIVDEAVKLISERESKAAASLEMLEA